MFEKLYATQILGVTMADLHSEDTMRASRVLVDFLERHGITMTRPFEVVGFEGMTSIYVVQRWSP